MKVTIEMTCDNAAFEDSPGEEIARILGKVASSFRYYTSTPTRQHGLGLWDINGNNCGTVTVEE